jgi:glutathione S-transferase
VPARPKLYWFELSHPSMAAKEMLELKHLPFETVTILPGTQRIHLRAVGFRSGTVPALKLDGRRIQGSSEIARALDVIQPDPPLFPRDPAQRARVEEAERWGERELQRVPRVLIRWGLLGDMGLRRWLAARGGMPMPGVAAHTLGPVARYYAHVIGADEDAARRVVRALPSMLDRADALLAEGVLVVEAPNAATLQILSSVRALDAFGDLREQLSGRPSRAAARQIFPSYPEPVPPFIPQPWLDELAVGAESGRVGTGSPR